MDCLTLTLHDARVAFPHAAVLVASAECIQRQWLNRHDPLMYVSYVHAQCLPSDDTNYHPVPSCQPSGIALGTCCDILQDLNALVSTCRHIHLACSLQPSNLKAVGSRAIVQFNLEVVVVRIVICSG
jgi:hypothetical protein